MTEVLGALLAATVLLAIVVVDVLRLHGRILARLHHGSPAPILSSRSEPDRASTANRS